MTIQWSWLLLSLALLLPPLPFSAALQKSLLSSRRRTFVTPKAAARVWQNWVDLARAAAGVYLLTQSITVDPASPSGDFSAFALQAAVLGVVLLAQTVRLMRNVRILAPVFFLCGLTLVFGGWLQGAFAVGASWLFAIGGKNMAYQLPSMAVALLLAGVVLGSGLPLMFNCGLIVLPMILSVLLKKRLLVAASAPAPA